MNLNKYKTMDIQLLFGLVNTALRNDCDSLDDLVKTHDLDVAVLCERLGTLGMAYDEEVNQFRPTASDGG